MIQSIDDDPITKPLPVLPASATLPGAKTDQAYLSLVVLVNNVSDENLLYNAYPADGTGRIRLMARARSLYEVEAEAHRFAANVVLIDSQMVEDIKALGQLIHSLRHHAKYPIITIGLCRDAQWSK